MHKNKKKHIFKKNTFWAVFYCVVFKKTCLKQKKMFFLMVASLCIGDAPVICTWNCHFNSNIRWNGKIYAFEDTFAGCIF